jgi:hypothetical protein
MTHLPRQSLCFCCVRDSLVCSLSAAAACISTATSRGVLGPLSGDDSCKPLVQFKGWLECNKTVLKADQDERPAFRNKYTHNNNRSHPPEAESLRFGTLRVSLIIDTCHAHAAFKLTVTVKVVYYFSVCVCMAYSYSYSGTVVPTTRPLVIRREK